MSTSPPAPVPNLVSIVVPCYKDERYLAQAIESCLRQTHRELEVIVVDDASPTPDAALAERLAAADPRVRVVRRPENGMISRALNSGYAVARGEFHSRLAQDDYFDTDAIARLVATLRAAPDAGLAYADMRMVDADGVVLQPMPCERPERALFPANRVGLCVMWPAAVYDAVGPDLPPLLAGEVRGRAGLLLPLPRGAGVDHERAPARRGPRARRPRQGVAAGHAGQSAPLAATPVRAGPAGRDADGRLRPHQVRPRGVRRRLRGPDAVTSETGRRCAGPARRRGFRRAP